MLTATKISPKTLENVDTSWESRFDILKNFANVLSKTRLRETKTANQNRWSEEKRAQKAALARHHKPWKCSTGPKTAEGKAKSSRNAVTHGMNTGLDGQVKRWLRLQSAYLRVVRHLNIKHWPDDPRVVRQRMMTLEELLRDMRKKLEAAKVETPALDARLLACLGGNFTTADLITKGMCPLSEEVIDNTLKFLDRRLRGEPVSRIAGEREFWGLKFRISPSTLDPRPDTETLVEAALKRVKSMPEKPLRILDLGTGSGCILLTLLTELPHAIGVGIDLNPGAVAVAAENAQALGVADRVEFRTGSWFEPLDSAESFDLIVSNPPYIPESDIESLAVDVKDFDPILALVGGIDGLDPYKIILKDIKKHLACGGSALFEIGKGQEKDLARLVEESNMSVCDSYSDLAGTLRVVEIAYGEN